MYLRHGTYMTQLNFISKSKQLTVDFWFHAGHERRSPEQESCAISSPSLTSYAFHSLSYFSLLPSVAAIMITTAIELVSYTVCYNIAQS